MARERHGVTGWCGVPYRFRARISKSSAGTLRIYCQAYARWRRAEEAIQEIAKKDPENGGLVLVTTNGNIVQNPLVGIANTSMRDAIRYGAEFGLTPSSRARLGIVATKQYEPTDKYFD